jgi:hypothetical protein
MKRLLRASLLVGVICSGTAAFAVDAVRQSTAHLRQVRGCMAKRMSTDRSLSYNEAKKACADDLKAQNQPAVPPVAAASAGGGK